MYRIILQRIKIVSGVQMVGMPKLSRKYHSLYDAASLLNDYEILESGAYMKKVNKNVFLYATIVED